MRLVLHRASSLVAVLGCAAATLLASLAIAQAAGAETIPSQAANVLGHGYNGGN